MIVDARLLLWRFLQRDTRRYNAVDTKVFGWFQKLDHILPCHPIAKHRCCIPMICISNVRTAKEAGRLLIVGCHEFIPCAFAVSIIVGEEASYDFATLSNFEWLRTAALGASTWQEFSYSYSKVMYMLAPVHFICSLICDDTGITHNRITHILLHYCSKRNRMISSSIRLICLPCSIAQWFRSSRGGSRLLHLHSRKHWDK